MQTTMSCESTALAIGFMTSIILNMVMICSLLVYDRHKPDASDEPEESLEAPLVTTTE